MNSCAVSARTSPFILSSSSGFILFQFGCSNPALSAKYSIASFQLQSLKIITAEIFFQLPPQSKQCAYPPSGFIEKLVSFLPVPHFGQRVLLFLILTLSSHFSTTRSSIRAPISLTLAMVKNLTHCQSLPMLHI